MGEYKQGGTIYFTGNKNNLGAHFELGTPRTSSPVVGMIWENVPNNFLDPTVLEARASYEASSSQTPIGRVLCTLCDNCLGDSHVGQEPEVVAFATRAKGEVGCGQQCGNPVKVEEV